MSLWARLGAWVASTPVQTSRRSAVPAPVSAPPGRPRERQIAREAWWQGYQACLEDMRDAKEVTE